MSTLRDPLLSTELGGDGEDGKAGEECKDGGRSQRGKRASTSEGGSALRRFTALTQHTLVSRTVGQVRRGAALLEGVVLRRSMSARDDGDEALATMLFDQISGIATSARPDGLLQYGDLVHAFRLFSFELTFSTVALTQRVDHEETLVTEFQYNLGRVIDIIDRRESKFTVKWDIERETRPLPKEELFELYSVIQDRNMLRPDSFMCDVVRVGEPYCERLCELFFKDRIEDLCAELAAKTKVFATLFMHFEANTESGDQDAQLSESEILEMLQVLGFDPRSLGLGAEESSLLPQVGGGGGAAPGMPGGDGDAGAGGSSRSVGSSGAAVAPFAQSSVVRVTPTGLNLLSTQADSERLRLLEMTNLRTRWGLDARSGSEGAGLGAVASAGAGAGAGVGSAAHAGARAGEVKTPDPHSESAASSSSAADTDEGSAVASARLRSRFARLVHVARSEKQQQQGAEAAGAGGGALGRGADVGAGAYSTAPPSSAGGAGPGGAVRNNAELEEELLRLSYESAEHEQRVMSTLWEMVDSKRDWFCPVGRIHAFFKRRKMRELDRNAFTSLCLYLMSPSADDFLVSASRHASIASDTDLDEGARAKERREESKKFALSFRHRMCLLYESAEGIELSVDWKAFFKHCLLWVLFPVMSVVDFYRRYRDAAILAASAQHLNFSIGFWRALFMLLIGLNTWCAAVVPPVLVAIGHRECLTLFEACYPCVSMLFAMLASATFRGYNARTIRPGTFKRHRLAVEVRNCAVACRDFESGKDSLMSAMDLLKSRNEMIRTRIRRKGRGGVRGLMEFAYLQELNRGGRIIWWAFTIVLRPACRKFIPSGSDGFVTIEYIMVGMMCTFGLSAVLVRMFVQFAHINRSWKMFSTIHNPVRARQRKERSVLLKESAGAGRLTGYIDLRRPENVRAWSKMRLYMQLVFADEIRGVEIFLAYSLLLMVIVIVLTGIYVVVPEILHSSGWKNTIMVVQLMMLGSMFAFPLLTIMANGVSINEALAQHVGVLSRARYSIQEEYAEVCATLGKQRALSNMLAHSRRLLADLTTVLKESDRPLRVLGLVLSMTLVRTISIALVTSVGSAALKTLQHSRQPDTTAGGSPSG